MYKTYTEPLELRACSCDMRGRWRPGAILATMQETAAVHSARLGLDRAAMDEMNLAWVLTRVKVEFSRLPVCGEKLRIETYPTPNRHLFFPRSHVFYDVTGAQIGCANSLWVTMDLGSRRIETSEFVLSRMPDNRDLSPAAGMPAAVRALDAEVRRGTVAAQFSDLDMNLHVNNTRYMDWYANALGLGILKDRAVTAFDISYDMEILPGCKISTELTVKDGRFAFLGFSEDGKRRFGVSGMLTPDA